jgi:EAL domain-containing protein (putative c-di-GMP-specific phosphodiesterase class I)
MPAQPGRSFRPQEPITLGELQVGLDGEELQLFYQPKVNVGSGTVAGVEALARWEHPERGLLGPAAFIPVAEEHGLIDALTRAVFRKAVRMAGVWQAGDISLHVSVNVSVNSFLRQEFSEYLINVARDAGVEPSTLILEVTESQVMTDSKGCLEQMMHLRMKRFGLSIDDFGTGHSSLAQLKRIPFTELKVDRAFVFGASQNSSARAILESSVNLGKKLKMSVVAEGAESREDWDLVEQVGCDFVQGYYVSRPMPENELLHFVKNWSGHSQSGKL